MTFMVVYKWHDWNRASWGEASSAANQRCGGFANGRTHGIRSDQHAGRTAWDFRAAGTAVGRTGSRGGPDRGTGDEGGVYGQAAGVCRRSFSGICPRESNHFERFGGTGPERVFEGRCSRSGWWLIGRLRSSMCLIAWEMPPWPRRIGFWFQSDGGCGRG